MTGNSKSERKIRKLVTSERLLEGGGFPVRRPFPTPEMSDVDPFLLFDHLGPVDWGPGQGIGAPDHPHRGFETVTYLLAGEMNHKDSSGHSGALRPGDVQWMTAGSGVVHSELPSPDFMKNGGTMHGFQIWVNLPASAKMNPPRYQDIAAENIPVAQSSDKKTSVRVIAGQAMGVSAVIDTFIPITYLHYTMLPGAKHSQVLPASANAFIYIVNGSVQIGPDQTRINEGQMVQLGSGDLVTMQVSETADTNCDLILLAGEPINEPIARYGPFVMNTEAEIKQAIRDYQEGKMGAILAE